MDKSQKTSTPMEKVFNDEKYSKLMRAVDATRAILDAMNEGDKTNLKDLTDRVSRELDLSVTQVSPFVGMAVQTYEGITVSRGRYGGIFKGIREKKEDARERCTTCKQVIRKRRAKKAKDDALVASGTDSSSTHDEEFDDEDEDSDDELDNGDNVEDEDEET